MNEGRADNDPTPGDFTAEPIFSPETGKRLCGEPECERVHYGKGRCRAHYRAWVRAQDKDTWHPPPAGPFPLGRCQQCGGALYMGKWFCSTNCRSVHARAKWPVPSAEVMDECRQALAEAELRQRHGGML